MQHLSTILALLIGIAGWHYLFYSRAAARLTHIESERLNRLRIWLRRAGGLVLVLLAPLFFAGFHTVNAEEDPQSFMAVWACVVILLGINVVLAMVDIGLTWKLRRQRLAAERSEP